MDWGQKWTPPITRLWMYVWDVNKSEKLHQPSKQPLLGEGNKQVMAM